jgi:hypothetical protein
MASVVARLGEHFEVDGRSVVLRTWSYEMKKGARAVATSPDGATLAIASAPSVWNVEASDAKDWRRAVLLLDRETLEHPRLLVNDWEIRALAFGPHGDVIATIGGLGGGFGSEPQPPFHNEIMVWRVADGTVLYKVPFNNGFAERVAFDADGALYIEAWRAGVRAFTLSALVARDLATIDGDLRTRLDRSAEDARLLRVPSNHDAYVERNPTTLALEIVVDGGARRRTIAPDFGMSHGLVPSPDGKRLYAAATMRGVLWDLERQARIRDTRDQFVGFDLDGQARVIRTSDGANKLVRLDDGTVLRELPGDEISRLTLDGSRGLVRRTPDLEWHDFTSGTCLRTWSGDSRAYRGALALSPRADVAIVEPGTYITMPCELWNLDNDTRLRLEAGHLDYSHAHYAFDTAGTFIALASVSPTATLESALVVAVFDVPSGAGRWKFRYEPPKGPELQAAAVAIDARGSLIAASYERGQRADIILFAANDGRVVQRIEGLVKAGGLAFSRDSSRLYVAYDAESIAVIEL